MAQKTIDRLFFWSWLLIILAILMTFQSCRVAKDRKAVNRVLNNRELLEQVGRDWEKNHPCVNDTVITTKSDTTIVTDVVFDTITLKGSESIEVVGPERTIYKTITRTVTIRDTVLRTVEDTRRLGIALDSVAWYKGVIQQRNGQISALQQEVKSEKAGKRKWQWSFWILLIIAGAIIFRKPLGRLVGIPLMLAFLISCADSGGGDNSIKDADDLKAHWDSIFPQEKIIIQKDSLNNDIDTFYLHRAIKRTIHIDTLIIK